VSCDGNPFSKSQEFPKGTPLSLGKIRHVLATLADEQNRAQGIQKNFLKIMAPRIAGASGRI
jgi:hypothetical protein